MRLIDADEIKYREQLEWFGNGRYEPMQFVYESDIDIQPTVDAVPVIRCKDCAFYLTGYEQSRYCAKDGILKRETYYCAGAERKDNGKVSND